MFRIQTMKSFCTFVALILLSSATQVSGQVILQSNAPRIGRVYTGWYRVGTPRPVLVNTTSTPVVTYLPACSHAFHSQLTIELYKRDGGSNNVIAVGRLNSLLTTSDRLFWPLSSSALNVTDSGTYKCQAVSPFEDSDYSYILNVVVPVKINVFELVMEVFTNASHEAVCCAEGYPEPTVRVTTTIGMVVKNVTKTSSSGGITVCRNVTLTAQRYGNFKVACQAMLSPFNCTPVPPAANVLCGATTNTTTRSEAITVNVEFCTQPAPPGNGLTCTDGRKFRSICTCREGFRPTKNRTTQCLGNGNWSRPIPKCLDIDECTHLTHNCSVSADCHNTNGSYDCTCHVGYLGDGRNCSVSAATVQQLHLHLIFAISCFLCFFG